MEGGHGACRNWGWRSIEAPTGGLTGGTPPAHQPAQKFGGLVGRRGGSLDGDGLVVALHARMLGEGLR